jgi:outer membrane protein OmpA-like peptidoglycan-associated protein
VNNKRAEAVQVMVRGCSAVAHLFLAAALVVPFSALAGDGETHLVIEGKVTLEVEAPAVRFDVPVTAPRATIADAKVQPMDALLFENDRAEPVASSLVALEAVAQVLAAHPTMKLRVEAHTDDAASPEYNQGLSKRRAAFVHNWLVRHGAPSVAITSEGFGSSRPVATNGTEAGRRLNRRVDFVIVAR